MAHKEQENFIAKVKTQFPDFFSNKKILEIGSRNVNGSVRKFFNGCDYWGIDLDKGPDVDEVTNGAFYSAASNNYDMVISTEMLEHTELWPLAFLNMYRMTKVNGLVVMTCATDGRKPHGYESYAGGIRYYRNVNELDMRDYFNFDNMFDLYYFEVNKEHNDLFFYGIKKIHKPSVI